MKNKETKAGRSRSARRTVQECQRGDAGQFQEHDRRQGSGAAPATARSRRELFGGQEHSGAQGCSRNAA